MNDKITRLAHIKTIGWTTLIIFGLTTYYVITQYISALLFTSMGPAAMLQDTLSEGSTALTTTAYIIKVVLLLMILFLLLVIAGAIGVIRLRIWGLILYHATSALLIAGIIGGLAYVVFYFQAFNPGGFSSAIDNYFLLMQRYLIISYGVFFLIIAWILTRSNILLSKKAYRLEFR